MKAQLLGAAMLLAISAGVSAAEPFFFIQIADPQLGMFTENRDFTQETANLEFAVAAINRLRPAFVVVSGDLVNKPGEAAQTLEYRRVIGRVDPRIPVYSVAGNHDIQNAPSPADLDAYTRLFGPDHYVFRHGDFTGIVLNSVIIHTPQHVADRLAAQEAWLQSALGRARADGARHIVVFAHHPWFLKTADEPDEYFNIPRERRGRHLAWFREAGVKALLSGHYHRNAIARDGDLEAVTTGPVGKPLGDGKSGLRIAIVRDAGIEHQFYHFGELPTCVDIKASGADRTAP